jgi:hypothetical protein
MARTYNTRGYKTRHYTKTVGLVEAAWNRAYWCAGGFIACEALHIYFSARG